MKLTRYFTLLIPILMSACSSTEQQENVSLSPGVWRATLQLQDQQLPFTFEVAETTSTAPSDSAQYTLTLINGEERIPVDEVTINQDSIKIPMLFFDTEIKAKIADGKMTGNYFKNYAEDYEIPFQAQQGESYRFIQSAAEEPDDVAGKWRVTFDDDTAQAVGIFEQKNDQLTGTFLTLTGDYRYLDGNMDGNQMMLSAFDGEHAFLFKAALQEDGTLKGDFWSGKSYHTTWTATRDEQAALADANELTFLKDGFDQLAFTFPNLHKEPVSLSDEKYQGKVVLVQLFGTWCPNCMDETIFLADWYKKHQDDPVEIIGLAYEQKDDFDYAKKRVQKMTEKLGVDYDFLIAGTSDKEQAAKTLPMLNHVLSFPTTIFIDKQGEVRNIHTGFSGPGTGEYYDRFVEDFNIMMDKLISEKADS